MKVTRNMIARTIPVLRSVRRSSEQNSEREELAGRMQPTTLGALKSDYPESRIRIASMGAIVKPDGSVRPDP